MPRAAQSGRGVPPEGTRLAALAAAVRAALAGRLDETLERWDANWSALTCGTLAAAGPSMAMAIDVSATPRRPRPRPRPVSVTPEDAPSAAPEPPDHGPEADDEPEAIAPEAITAEAITDVSAEHTEVWQLVARAQEGDGDAFGQLYDRYVDTVYRFIYFRVNDRGLAEDFTSETFLRALRRIGSISYQGRDIGAWFVTIARNIVFDHMKSARNRLEVVTGDTIEGDRYERSTETAVLESLTSERLMAAVQQLGDEQRECVMLRFIQGFSVSETAAVMGKNDGAIKALQHRAIRKLAELVGGELR